VSDPESLRRRRSNCNSTNDSRLKPKTMTAYGTKSAYTMGITRHYTSRKTKNDSWNLEFNSVQTCLHRLQLPTRLPWHTLLAGRAGLSGSLFLTVKTERSSPVATVAMMMIDEAECCGADGIQQPQCTGFRKRWIERCTSLKESPRETKRRRCAPTPPPPPPPPPQSSHPVHQGDTGFHAQSSFLRAPSPAAGADTSLGCHQDRGLVALGAAVRSRQRDELDRVRAALRGDEMQIEYETSLGGPQVSPGVE
jgi:hypothetical protein